MGWMDGMDEMDGWDGMDWDVVLAVAEVIVALFEAVTSTEKMTLILY